MDALPFAGYKCPVKYFNTTGPCDERWHYMLPAAERLPEARRYIDRGQYFVVHAPRQTGKTTTLAALARALTAEGRYAALHFSCEAGSAWPDDPVAAQRAVVGALRGAARENLPEDLRPRVAPDSAESGTAEIYLSAQLEGWSSTCPRPIVLFMDEIDALRGESLRSVLSQLRAAFASRPAAAPWSVVLCGLRDVRDYKVASGGSERLGSSSPFNIKVESFRLGDFSPSQVSALLEQHTDEAGQAFVPAAKDAVFAATRGQPWLVNALAAEVLDKMGVTGEVTSEHIAEARERLILARATHLDSLVARLGEPRVRAIVQPIIEGTYPDDGAPDAYQDDVQYVVDLGLIRRGRPPEPALDVANPIYREVIVRVLTANFDPRLTADPRRFVRPDGGFDLPLMLREFADFWREHGDILITRTSYHEVAPQLVLMALLQRVVNGGGFIDREYGIGRGRVDLLLRWPLPGGGWQREAIELKVWRSGRGDPLPEGLRQLDEYLARLHLEAGVLIVFDRRGGEIPAARFEQRVSPAGRAVEVVRV